MVITYGLHWVCNQEVMVGQTGRVGVWAGTGAAPGPRRGPSDLGVRSAPDGYERGWRTTQAGQLAGYGGEV